QRDVPDLALEPADLRRVARDLVAQRLLLLLVRGQLSLQRRDLCVELVLLGDVVPARRRGEDEQGDECEREAPHTGRVASCGGATPAGRSAGRPRPGADTAQGRAPASAAWPRWGGEGG